MSPYIFFVSVGIILLLVAIILGYQGASLWSDLLLNLGVSVTAVTVIEFMWKRVGGDPISKAIALLRTATSLLRDLEGTGIEGIYPKRDKVDLEKWINNYMKSAKEVDLMSNNLYRDWTSKDEFLKIIEERGREKRCKFRIMVLDPSPDSSVTTQRGLDEGNAKRLRDIIRDSLNKLQQVKESIDEKLGKKEGDEYFKIKVINRSNVYCYIVRADAKMIVANYLSHIRGARLPALQIHGQDTSFFKVYKEEFENMWKISSDWAPPVVE